MFPTQIDGPVLAVGDLQGAYEQVKALLDFVMAHDLHQGRFLVFLGDIVGGPDTARTIELLLAWHKLHPQTTFCQGNHDLNLCKALGLVPSPHQEYYLGRMPTRNRQTLASYGAKFAQELLEKMPNCHKDFLANLPWCVEHPDFLFVHAGIDPGDPLEQQLEQLRIRDTSLYKPKWLHDNSLSWCVPQDTDKTVVSGHVILAQPIVTERRILLDTGCGYAGPLTACLLPERILIQVSPLNRTKETISPLKEIKR